MRKVSIAVLIFIAFCCNNSNSIPPDIIKPAQMQSIFWDMFRGDILAQEMIKKDTTQNIKSTSLAITEKILAVHKTDRIQLEKSLAFYERHPVLMRTIFDSLSAVQARQTSTELERKYRPAMDDRFRKSKKIP